MQRGEVQSSACGFAPAIDLEPLIFTGLTKILSQSKIMYRLLDI